MEAKRSSRWRIAPRDAVTIRVIEGLGNQMFQYAAALALARCNDTLVFVDISATRRNITRPYMLDKLRVPRTSVISEGSVSNDCRGLPPDRLVQSSAACCYREPHFHFDQAFFDLKPPVLLRGCFQSERYFAPVAGELKGVFGLREELSEQSRRIEQQIGGEPSSISLHVRRGDYVANDYHGVLSLDYYRRAVEIVRQGEELRSRVFIFSDDPAFAVDAFGFIDNKVVITHNLNRPWEDLALMASCRHHIIANSTFSWWGAWLGRRADQIVVAPRAWFGPEVLRVNNICDLHPAGWVLI